MNYEKYNNALEKAKVRYSQIKGTDCNEEKFLLDLFPELKESEDEKIRKNIIKLLSANGKKDWVGIPTEKYVAWLEKQNKNNSENYCKDCINRKGCANCENGNLKETIKTTAYGTFGEYGAVEYVYILDYSTGRVIVAKHDIKESIEDFFKKLGLKENQCHYMVSSDILSIEYINF